MRELPNRVCEATGLDEAAAPPAIGHVLQFMRDHAPESSVAELVEKIPGAQQAMTDKGIGYCAQFLSFR
jgi:hypothetical protein